MFRMQSPKTWVFNSDPKHTFTHVYILFIVSGSWTQISHCEHSMTIMFQLLNVFTKMWISLVTEWVFTVFCESLYEYCLQVWIPWWVFTLDWTTAQGKSQLYPVVQQLLFGSSWSTSSLRQQSSVVCVSFYFACAVACLSLQWMYQWFWFTDTVLEVNRNIFQ